MAESSLQCAHFDNDTYVIKAKCDKHDGQNVKVCFACQKKYKNKGCPVCETVTGGKVTSQSFKFKQSEFEVGFLSLMPRGISSKDEETKSEEPKEYSSYAFDMLILKDEEKKFPLKAEIIHVLQGKDNQLAQDKVPCYAGICRIAADKYIVSGGFIKTEENIPFVVSDCYIITITQNKGDFFFTASEVDSMKSVRMGHKLFHVDGKVYVFGGNSQTEYLTNCEVFDVETKKWSDLDQLKQPISQYSGQVVGKKIIIMGGFIGPDQEKVSNVFECFDTQTNKWESFILKRPLGLKKENVFPLSKSGVIASGQELFVFGGGDGNEGPTANIYQMTAENNSKFFLNDIKMDQTRSDNCAEDTDDGKVYIFGGGKKPTVEVYQIEDKKLTQVHIQDVNATFLEGMSNDGKTFNKTEEGISVEYGLFTFYPVVAFR